MAKTGKVVLMALGVLAGILFVSNIWTYMALQDKTIAYSNLQNQINSLTDEKNNLQNQMNSLNTTYQNYKATHSYTDSEYNALNSQITSLQNQVSQLQTDKTNLQNQISSLNQSYQELLVDYEKLLNDYKLLNAPASIFVSARDLNFSITTYQHIYSYRDPVLGNVTIYYHNGTAFKGAFAIYFELQPSGPICSGWTFNVDGYGEFHLNPPAFLYGPGTYRIGVCILYDSEGYMIVLTRDEYVYVTVEAK